MPYISLSIAELKKTDSDEQMAAEARQRLEKSKKVFRHPIRSRIVNILRDGKPRTQQELGKLLSMSNAAVHYHVKLLFDVGIIKLHATRPGPKGITEKLYTVAVENWPDVSEDDMDYYLAYMMSWINERNREGVNLIKKGKHDTPFLAGSYTARAPLEALIRFKHKIEALFNDFYAECEQNQAQSSLPFALTFSLIPSREEQPSDTRNILEFEPENSQDEAT